MNANEKLSIFGYPGVYYKALDKQFERFSVVQKGCSMDYSAKIVESYRIDYSISTLPGQSGCPVVLSRGEQSIAIAIHKASVPNEEFNTARLIDVKLLSILEKWRE